MVTDRPDPYSRELTHRDLDEIPDDGNLYEVIDGVLHVTPFPTTAHQHAVTQLVFFLVGHVRKQRLGRVFTAGLKVVLDEPTGLARAALAYAHWSHRADHGAAAVPKTTRGTAPGPIPKLGQILW